MITLDTLLELAEKQARRVLLEEGEKQLIPMFALVSAENDITIVGCPWGNDMEKQLMIAALKARARDLNAVALCSVSEAWATVHGVGVDPESVPKPSQSPDRKEMVIAVATDGVITKSLILNIERDWKGKIRQLVAEPKMSGEGMFSGRMVDGILPVSKTLH